MRMQKIAWIVPSLLFVSLLVLLPAQAGEKVLNVNSTTGSEVWFISGEKSLVMNGFDLTPLSITLPAAIDRVTISVNKAVPGQTSELVIYQDSNGGSPADATLVGRQTVNIESTGPVTITLAQPAIVTAPVVWVGFYLPVGFEFLADTSGTSVLTYWAWTENSTFDDTRLSNAGVLGPADGSAPVNINLGGKARITAEISGANAQGTPVVVNNPQTIGASDANLAVLRQYANCVNISYDTEDERISYRDIIELDCRELETWHAPQDPLGYSRRALLYDVIIFQSGETLAGPLPIEVTHCIAPVAEDLERAVLGVATGAPKAWRILPSQRFGNLVCAELPHAGLVAYFVPST
jgi:hypothetical protein